MTERERLIELLNNVGSKVTDVPTDGFIKHLADHLLANGVIVPPCKVGDVLYTTENCVNRPEKIVVTAIHQYEKYTSIRTLSRSQKVYVYTTEDFGKCVFAAKEEAEQALRKEDD